MFSSSGAAVSSVASKGVSTSFLRTQISAMHKRNLSDSIQNRLVRASNSSAKIDEFTRTSLFYQHNNTSSPQPRINIHSRSPQLSKTLKMVTSS